LSLLLSYLTMYNIRIPFWNCRGAPWIRLKHFITYNNLDIVLLNEIHLAQNENFNLPNFHSYHSKRTQITEQFPGSGTSILINRKFIHQHILINTLSVENTTIIHINTLNEELNLIYVQTPQHYSANCRLIITSKNFLQHNYSRWFEFQTLILEQPYN